MKRKLESISLIISPDNQQVIQKDKVLIGSAPNCDIVLDHPSVSHYHAMIKYCNGGSFTILDLGSKNGTYINGGKVQDSFIASDDTLTIGKLHIELHEDFVEEFEFTDGEVVQEIVEEKVYVPEKGNKNQVLIDDEYCDIIFDEAQEVTLNNSPLINANLATDEFVELDELQESYDILEKTDGLAIQVSTLSNGSILEQYYVKLVDSTIYASGVQGPSRIPIEVYEGDQRIPFISITGGNITVHPLTDFAGLSSDRNLSENDIIIQNIGSYQVFVELVPAPSRLKYISQITREKEFFKDAAKQFSAIVLPMLLLLLIDLSKAPPETQKKLSVIYRKPMQSANNKKIASQTPSKTQENTGNKTNKQDTKKLEFAKAGQTKSANAAQKVAQTSKQQAAKSAKSKAKTPVKAYEFKMNTSSLFASSNNVTVNKNNAPSALTAGSDSASVSNTKVTAATGEVGKMGKDSRGRGTASYGVKGLSSNAGMDTAYIEPKTVVLGSMDPELLRKILREYLPQFRHCYQQELVNNSDKIKGVVDLNFEINKDGKVNQIKVVAKDSRFSRRGTDCMAQVLSIIDFPRPKGGGRVAVRQPLNFFSEKERS